MATPTDLDVALARRTAILTELSTTNWSASYGVDGVNMDMVAYRNSLIAELKELNATIIPALAGPFTFAHVGRG